MFDVLVYLFEHFHHPEACPTEDQLVTHLHAEGFEQDEISDALGWLAGLREVADQIRRPCIAPDKRSIRIYSEPEKRALTPECLGFLTFLESAGVLDAVSRELIIERAMSFEQEAVPLSRFKLITLMVLWQQEVLPDSLVLDELLCDEDETDEYAALFGEDNTPRPTLH
jgi:Smg protein